MTIKSTKLTKKEIIEMLLGEEFVQANEIYVAYLENERDILTRKATSKKLTKAQEENIALKKEILSAMTNDDVKGTITEIQKAIPTLAEYSNQKISSLFKQMVDGGEVTKTVEKGKAIFSVS